MNREELITKYLSLKAEIEELEKKVKTGKNSDNRFRYSGIDYMSEINQIKKKIYKKILEKTYIEAEMELLGISIDDIENDSNKK